MVVFPVARFVFADANDRDELIYFIHEVIYLYPNIHGKCFYLFTIYCILIFISSPCIEQSCI
jgi:hypothetical protein